MRQMIVAGTVLAVLAAGCGDDGGSTPEGGASGPPVTLTGTVNDHGTKDASGEVAVELDDFYFGPTFLRAQPSAALTLKLKNEGEATHTFTADGFGVDVTVQPGQTGDASITLPASGAVRFYCRFHQGQGMQGAFFFNVGDTLVPGSGGGSSPTSTSGGDGAYNQ